MAYLESQKSMDLSSYTAGSHFRHHLSLRNDFNDVFSENMKNEY